MPTELGSVYVSEVDYLTTLSVVKDPQEDTPSEGPNFYTDTTYDSHWRRTFTGVDAPPVAFSSGLASNNKRLSLTATFQTTDWSGPTWIRGVSSGGYDIPKTVATVSLAGDSLTISGVMANNDFNDGAQYFEEFAINWQLSTDDGATWIHIDQSVSTMYVTWKDPTTTLYETVLFLGTTNAAGAIAAGDRSSVVSAIWLEFIDYDVRTVGGTRLVYNHEPQPSLESALFQSKFPDSARELIVYSHGQCNGWSQLFAEMLNSQGITGHEQAEIKSLQGDGFVVKNVEFGAPESYAGLPPGFQYFTGSGNVDAKGSVASQGLPVGTEPEEKPAGQWFFNHWVLKLDDVIYDPSYGGKYSTLLEWEQNSVAGQYIAGSTQGEFYVRRRPATTSVLYTYFN